MKKENKLFRQNDQMTRQKPTKQCKGIDKKDNLNPSTRLSGKFQKETYEPQKGALLKQVWGSNIFV